ncbi:MAG: hypothetical protein K2M00_07930, partial [Muribaculaceae bacterium]|nr:hypothetical protein [Muribaculaceae bacterium]
MSNFESFCASILALVVALGGFIFSIFQWRKSIKIRRAEFINQLIEKLRFDKTLSETIYKLEYSCDGWYDSSFHHSPFELQIDRLFSYLDYICYLKDIHNISEVEFKIFRYN